MSSLEGQAADRKAKLAALRNKRKQPATSSTEADQSEPEKKKTTNNERYVPIWPQHKCIQILTVY
jgi:hypothetical protein